jgi:hypothetical protein
MSAKTEAKACDEGVPLTPVMRAVGNEIADHLEAIGRLFNAPVKITLLVRNPAAPDGSRDVFLSSDDWPAARAAVERLQKTRPEFTV